MNKKKVLAVIILVSILMVITIGGMVAYLTDTETATNTITIGSISISVTESSWVPSNAQNLTPGAVVNKNPVITNTSPSNSAYVYAKVEVPYYNNAPLFTLNNVGSGWTLLSTTPDSTNNVITYVYAWGTASQMTVLNAGVPTSPVFESVTLANISADDAAAMGTNIVNIKVTGYGIQSNNLGTASTPEEIWELF